MQTPLSEIYMHSVGHDCLMEDRLNEAGYYTLEDLEAVSDSALKQVHGIGPKTIALIRERIIEFRTEKRKSSEYCLKKAEHAYRRALIALRYWRRLRDEADTLDTPDMPMADEKAKIPAETFYACEA